MGVGRSFGCLVAWWCLVVGFCGGVRFVVGACDGMGMRLRMRWNGYECEEILIILQNAIVYEFVCRNFHLHLFFFIFHCLSPTSGV